MLRLGVTREGSQLVSLIKKAAEKNIEIIPLPLIKTESIDFNISAELGIENIDWLLFTSANGVKSFFERLKQLNLNLSEKTKIGVVGFKTEAALIDYDRKADFVPPESYGENLFGELSEKEDIKNKNIVYSRAETVVTDPSEIFKTNGANFYSIITYKTTQNLLPRTKLNDLKTTDYILFTAPSTVHSFASQFNQPISQNIAIGNTTAEAMKKENWKIDFILDKPDINRVLEYL